MKTATTKTKPRRPRKTKAALAAGAVASCVAATAAYRRHNARRHLGGARQPNPTEHRFATAPATDFGAGTDAGPGDTQPL
jgi:hypothetical protein